ncbi:MAG: TolC family protein [Phycisphaera sp.]|nr:TolC family protein [Phycisphaera sp.]
MTRRNGRRNDTRRTPRAATGVAALACAIGATIIVGCAPERYSAFQVDWQKQIPKHPGKSLEPKSIEPVAVTQDKPAPLPSLEGDGPLALSVEQATLLALRNNRDLAVERFNPVIVGAYEQIERGVFDPEVFAGLHHEQGTAEETARSTGARFSVDARETGGGAGVRQKLPSGTTVEATVDQTRNISNRAPEQHELRLGLTVTQSLLRGFGPAVNLATVRQAELDTVASTYELRGYTEALLAEAETAYWRYVLAEQEIAIFERSLEVAKQQLADVRQRIDVGDRPEAEAAAARAEVARREQALIDARSVVEERRLRLVRLINPGATGQLGRQVRAVTEPKAADAQPITDVDDRLKLAQAKRPEVNEAMLRLEQRRLETVVTRNGLLPKLDLFVTVGKSGFADTFTDSFSNLRSETYDFAAGVSISQTLGRRAAEARDQIAWSSRRQAAAAVTNLRQLIDLDVRLAVNEVDRAHKQIQATATTRVLQEQTLEAERQRFNVGASTALLVAQAQRDLLAAQIDEAQAIVNYRIALIGLYLAEGSLLDRRGIRIDAPDLASRRQTAE